MSDRTMVLLRVGALALCHALEPSLAAAQKIQISVTDRCTCTVSAEKVLSLGGNSAPDSIALMTFARDSRGRIAAVGSNGSVIIYDSAGAYTTSLHPKRDSTGRASIHAMEFGKGDSLYVFGRPALLTVYTSDLVAAHTESDAERFRAGFGRKALLSNGRILTTSSRPTSSSFGDPFHTWDLTGQFVRSFGGDTTIPRPQRPPASVLPFKVTPDKSFVWAFILHADGKAEFRQWDVDGGLRSIVEISGIPKGGSLLFSGVDNAGRIFIQRSAVRRPPESVTVEPFSTIYVFDVMQRLLLGTVEFPTGNDFNMVTGSDLLAVATRFPSGSPRVLKAEFWRVNVSSR